MDYMSEFKPRIETIRFHDTLINKFQELADLVKDSPEIDGKQASENILGILAIMYQWVVSQGSDLANYSQAIASRIDSNDGMDEDTFNLLTRLSLHLEELDKLFSEMKEVLPENVVALGGRNQEFCKELKDLLSSIEGEDGDEESLFLEDENNEDDSSDTEESNA